MSGIKQDSEYEREQVFCTASAFAFDFPIAEHIISVDASRWTQVHQRIASLNVSGSALES